MLLRVAILGCAIGFSFAQATTVAQPQVILDFALQVMQQCYEVKHQMGAQLAECMNNTFKNIPNPEHYKINLNGDVPGDSKLFIYNQAGYRIYCDLFTGKTLIVKQCFDFQGKPLTKGQTLSITPPSN
ncbi:hypothetical protein [Legionella jamestowniensis]|uniref:Uncharacterized protein n=1 Tax=Legionella jamestowniensis TaxID=455 RepID=A0A0W0UGD3_9GAMM|nr:hypothetical protein [Legionella jamestowniensis]KTD06931.1 hypothetical protein Ljam_1126 [Legionella jamestowniensis]OCH97453.1 hypothetical protein A8135_02975 [Legionella jamestowniensis]SFL84931.1 hypothetical protein SAMN02746073_2242 [Legionella jamestowniensis DSM 19215]